MASFDVENLFTNVPLYEIIDIISSQLYASPTSLIIGVKKIFA